MSQRFSHTQYPVNALIEQIDSGDLRLPDLQRPFVWKRARVRDLFDSLYRGYPAGYFLLWSTQADIDSHAVATSTGASPSAKMIVDGQQRLTSIYAVMKGKAVVNENHDEQIIRISFNPLTEEFAVADAARENDPEWLTDISQIWTNPSGEFAFVASFISALEDSREVSSTERNRIGENLGKLANLRNFQFSALELSSDLDIDEVAEVFQRINSTGIALNSADFILTLMSVHVKEARHRLEDFSRAAKKPSSGPSPYNHFLAPSPDELLRVCVGLGLNRGVLQNAYHSLRGQDTATKTVSQETREANFAKLLAAQEHVLNLTYWHEYIVCVKRAGYRSGSMLTSTNNFLYCYLVYLKGRVEYKVEPASLREAVARWFFMSSLTGRYTGSPETILEADLRRFADVDTAEEFIEVIDRVIDTQLTSDYWDVTLPEMLESSGHYSPYLFGYYASLNLLDAKALFSNMKINDLFDPGVTQTKHPVERHHLFPKAYLSSIGIVGARRTNQIANFAYVEWADNTNISDTAPAEYFPKYFERMAPTDRDNAAFLHALPPGWEHMEYFEFLRNRRKRMSAVVRKAFEHLRSGDEASPKTGGADALPTVSDLLRQMETQRVEFKKSARAALENDAPEKVINDGVIKTVAAFLNTAGGTLAIGITDDGDVLGLQPDLDFKNQDLDSYQNWLSTLLVTRIGTDVIAAHVGFRIEPVGSEVVCLVDVQQATTPVYAKTTKDDHCFYVRLANSTRELTGPEIQGYITSHWA